ncbi:ARM repeat-containing protein [Gonapodya prolifera JEL478]|uniref:ARM repeat-containing protein n=1 Tax=Gonapodya prolifera (strain JEL478) TaxID=1344416 RepID=A0A139AZN6_GONPJ|nr:ARM repeat-containing protein [Gonapodya prolifera JEL478]|eukprot:KXS22023.1 ARM repeat-containing protein [Gonapodya prolifera JEL478]
MDGGGTSTESISSAGNAGGGAAAGVGGDGARDGGREKDTKREARLELRKRNTDAAMLAKSRADYANSKTLDTSFKRCTAFTKKLKTSLGAESAPSLLKDIFQLRLDKYAEEMATSIAESRPLKNTLEVWAATEVASAAHQRIPDFSTLLASALLKSLKDVVVSTSDSTAAAAMTEEQKEKEEASRVSRLRSILRLLTELNLVGVVPDPPSSLGNVSDGASTSGAPIPTPPQGNAASKQAKESLTGGEPIVTWAIKSITSADKDFTLTPVLTTFARFYLDYFPHPSSSPPTFPPFPTPTIRPLLLAHLASLTRHLLASHARLRASLAGLKEHAIARGHVHEERQDRHDAARRRHERGMLAAKGLAEAIGGEVPEMPPDETPTAPGGMSGEIKFGATGRGEDEIVVGGMWEDEETRRFYEEVGDLAERVPLVLLGLGQKGGTGTTTCSTKADQFLSAAGKDRPTPATKESTSGDSAEGSASSNAHPTTGRSANVAPTVDDFETPEPIPDVPDDDDGVSSSASEDEDTALSGTSAAGATGGAPGGPSGLTLPTLMARLPDLGSRGQADQFAVDFCYLNTKNARKRLVKEVVELAWEKAGSVPYVARVVAEVGKYVADVKAGVVEGVEKEFHRQFKKRGFVEERVKTVRLIAELTKFRVSPPHLAFHCLKVLLDSLTGNNVDVLCALVEGVGRWLVGGGAEDEGVARMKGMLEVMVRKKNAQHMDNRHVMMLENAYYQAVPPERPAISAKPRTPLQLFLRHLFYAVLSKTTVERVLKILRKLDWDDPQVVRMLEGTHFRKVWKVRYGNVHLVAFLASELARWHPDFGVSVVDGVLEEVRVGLEQNIFKHNQQRIAIVKYLGELYNYRMVESSVIFDTLYTILTFGHGRPRPDVFVPLDPPSDFFRTRLITTLLDTCGRTFDSGVQAKKLDAFLTFFQLYLLSKQQPVPRDVEFIVDELFEELRPKARRFDTYEEASDVFEADLAEELRRQGEGVPQADADESESEAGDAKAIAPPAEEEVGEDGGGDGYGGGSEQGSTDGEADSDEDHTSQPGDPDGEPDLVVYIEEALDEQPTKEEEDEFDRTLREMVTQGIEERRGERRTAQFDAALPLRGLKARKQAETSSESEGEKHQEDQSAVQFTFLTKHAAKGRPAPRALAVPMDSSFVQAAAAKREQEREEQARMKELVLGYEKREQEAEDLAAGIQAGWSARIQKLANQMSTQMTSEASSRGGRSKRGGTTVVRIVSSNRRTTGTESSRGRGTSSNQQSTSTSSGGRGRGGTAS